ncbi:hypothetical protein I204_00567 [Kwoniella mangroviensis CBS 8886]|uniref:uncharacterized protein n=1 Tax=Kwoniella mangroviensis CBS 8507 TaxID=1296122 RepID=UPI00080CEF55|nr:uncharacterized protein I203_07185 [Kwoniella mangroviensis CBS 8507]OCF63864.1 hypothetical protein I203_07185 [Kwoniella mangroviensis CBS 8507]OCF78625.1 hypothetical protein I204_00567 [Kwoniella mangroviensis CBS 8886]
MNTFISASSPLFEYQPCKACNISTGFSSGSDFTGRDYNGTESGMITQTGDTSVTFNCTGSGVSFDVSYSQPLNSSFTPSLIVNGSSSDASNGVRANGTSITNLPLGKHSFQLSFNRTSHQNNDEWVRVNGANCNVGYQMISSQTNTEIIDDSAWRTWKVYLTPGWNMLEEEGISNYIDLDQYQAELPTASRDYNGSISWTEQANAANEIHFTGSAVWVHGIVGDVAGSYEVVLDNVTQGVFNASGGPRVYNSILYHTSDLADTDHSILLRNLEQGKRLSFDRLVAMSGLNQVANYSSSLLPTSSSEPSSSASQLEVSSYYPTATGNNAQQQDNISTSLSGGAIAGIVVAASIVVATFMITWIFACLKKRQDQRKNEQTELQDEREQREKSQTTFFRFSSRAPSPTPGHPFHPLPSPKQPQPQPLVTQQSQHPIPTPRKPTTSRLFNFSSPTPSLRSFIQNHTTASIVSEKDGRGSGTSFLKLNNNRFSRSAKHHQRNESNADTGSEILNPLGHGAKKSIAGLNISNPQRIHQYPTRMQREKSEDYLPSLASHTREVPLPDQSPPPPPPPETGPDNTPILPIRTDSIASSSTTNGRRETISPLVAALSGKTSSPLAELSRSASKRLTSPLGGVFTKRKGANPHPNPNEGGRRSSVADSLDTKRESKFGGGSIKTAKTEFDPDESGGDGIGILTMYATLPPGPASSQRNTAFDYSPNPDRYDEYDQAGQDNISGVGVALGSPMQDQNFQWEGNAQRMTDEMEEEEQFKPPTRRFLGLGDRPKSGVSNKSGKTVSSIGSGWRYM